MPQRTPLDQEELDKKILDIHSLTQVFDLINIHIVITDEHGNVLYMNGAAEEKTGYSKSESIGKNPGDLWGGHENDEFYNNLWATIKTSKKSFTGEVKNKGKDGIEIIQQLNIIPLLDEAGNIIYYVAVEPTLTKLHDKAHELQNQINVLFTSAVERELKISELKAEITSLTKQTL